MNQFHVLANSLFNLLPNFVAPGKLPAECEPAFYRQLHDDLQRFPDRDLLAHFKNHGIAEGRIGSPAAHREGLIAAMPTGVAVLEIGPFTKPALRGPKVKYLDIMDRAALIERAERLGYPVENPVQIDYVSPSGSLQMIGDNSFDAVFSSHCLEHQPDLIGHLDEVARVLKPKGAFYLVVPDKRYCFDHFIDASSIDDIRKAHRDGRRSHTIDSVIRHFAYTTHNDSIRHWAGDHGDPNPAEREVRIAEARRAYEHASGPADLDVHAWQFEPATFRTIMETLHRDRDTRLRPERIYETIWGQLEFTAVLHKVPPRGWRFWRR